MEHTKHKKHESHTGNIETFSVSFGKTVVFLLVLVAALTLFNQWQIAGIDKTLDNAVFASESTSGTSRTSTTASTSTSTSSSSSASPESTSGVLDIIPTGVPAIYGDELGVSFDDVTASNRAKTDETIGILASLDRQITLSGDDLERYIDIASQISCEYCCGARSIISSSGDAACGCAHSYAMRGLAKYLITDHSDEYTNDEVLEELGKWKTLFFPTQAAAKAQVLDENGIELSYINLASNKYKGAEKGTLPTGGGGGMVGGC